MKDSIDAATVIKEFLKTLGEGHISSYVYDEDTEEYGGSYAITIDNHGVRISDRIPIDELKNTLPLIAEQIRLRIEND